MVGDVNLFMTDPSDPSLAELEIMIAGDSLDDSGLDDSGRSPNYSLIHHDSSNSLSHNYLMGGPSGLLTGYNSVMVLLNY